METTQPRITVQNTDEPNWLVTSERLFNEHESLLLTMRIPKDPSLTVQGLEKALLARVIPYLQGIHDRL